MSALAERLLLRSLEGIVMRAPQVVIACVILAAIALGYALLNLGIDTSTEEMISADVKFRRDHIAYVRAFPEFRQTIVAVVEGAAPERVEEAAADLAAALRADGEHFVAVDNPEGDPFFARQGLLYLELEELADLTDRLAAAQPLLAALAEDPSLRGLAAFVELALEERDSSGALPAELDRLLGAMADAVAAQLTGRPGEVSWRRALQDSGQSAPVRQLVVAQPRFDQASLALAGPAIEALRAHAEPIMDAAGLRLRLTGEATINHEELQSVRAGATLAAVLTTLAVSGLLIWGLGSLRLIAATLITLALGLIVTAAFAALTIGRLNLISVTFAVLFVGLGVDFGIHLVLRYREALAARGDHSAALRSAIAGVSGPLSLSALCAAFGFLAFVPTDYRGLAELGVISAAGMAIAWLASLTLLPALLDLMPLPPPRRPLAKPRLLTGIQHHPRPIVVIAVLGALAAAIAPSHLAFDFNPLNLKDPESESVRTFRALAADPATSPEVIDVLAGSLAQADALAAELTALDEVERAVTLSDFVPAAQDEKLGLIDDLAFYLGPILDPVGSAEPLADGERQLALEHLGATAAKAAAAGDNPGASRLAEALARFAQTPGPTETALGDLERRLTGTLLDLLERLRQLLEAGPVTLADLPQSLREGWVNAAGQARILVRPAAPLTDNATLEEFARAVLAVAPDATGTPVIVMAGGEAVVGAFQKASWIALALIAVLLVVVLGRLRDILLVLAPLGLAVLLTAASAVLLDLSLNFANVIVLPLLLGLGVSGAIHVVMRWREEADPEKVAATSTPRAVLFSALTTIASFGSLALSDHRGLASMGLLLTIAILWSLVCTLIVLPGVLALVGKAGRGE
ncbi:MAG TPA: MMPL family transporter [Geminicoccaceae bacterium]|nr:MMPL family transporter [Geminicoccaceae bacterium]